MPDASRQQNLSARMYVMLRYIVHCSLTVQCTVYIMCIDEEFHISAFSLIKNEGMKADNVMEK